MALSKEVKIDAINIVGDYRKIQIRIATIIKEDNKELSRTFERRMLAPGTLDLSDKTLYIETDISGEESWIQSICNACWTTEIKDAHKAFISADPFK